MKRQKKRGYGWTHSKRKKPFQQPHTVGDWLILTRKARKVTRQCVATMSRPCTCGQCDFWTKWAFQVQLRLKQLHQLALGSYPSRPLLNELVKTHFCVLATNARADLDYTLWTPDSHRGPPLYL